MSVFGPIRRSSLVALAITVCLGTAGPLVRVHDAAGREQRLTCGNFRSQSDAQATFTADSSDPFGLDDDNNGVACQAEERFGTSPLVTCDDLRDYPDAQQALQGLYDHTRATGDPYALDADGNGIACDRDGTGDGRADREPLDGPPESRGRDQAALDGPAPDQRRAGAASDQRRIDRETRNRSAPVPSRGPHVVVRTGALSRGMTLEARLEARFAALEAQFAAFEVRAENGFGRVPESRADVTAGVEATTVIISTAQQIITTTQRTRANADTPMVRVQQAKDGDGEHGKERTSKRNHHKGKHRNRH